MSAFLKNLRPQHCRLIHEITQNGQLQMAATACALSQPAASRMLAEIERSLGTTLFERGPKGMEPTEAGALIAVHARRVVDDLNRLDEEFADWRAGRAGEIRVGAVTGPALGELVPAIQWMKTRVPNIDISIEVAPSAPLVKALELGQIDFALARLPPQADDRLFHIEPARPEIIRLMVREGHPMLSQLPVSIADLHDFPWIMQDRGMPIRRAMEEAFHAEGLNSPANVITASSLLLIVALLRESDAIAPMSQEVMELMLQPPVSAGFRNLALKRTIAVEPYMILRAKGRNLSRAAQMLLDRVSLLTRQRRDGG